MKQLIFYYKIMCIKNIKLSSRPIEDTTVFILWAGMDLKNRERKQVGGPNG
jgi:hypothetical protein